MTGRRLYVYWNKPGPAPVPGETMTLNDGSRGVVETAHASSGAIEKRKLIVIVAEKTIRNGLLEHEDETNDGLGEQLVVSPASPEVPPGDGDTH